MKKTIIWKGPERMLPGIGLGTAGEELTMDAGEADSYVKQGLADLKRAAPIQKSKKEG